MVVIIGTYRSEIPIQTTLILLVVFVIGVCSLFSQFSKYRDSFTFFILFSQRFCQIALS